MANNLLQRAVLAGAVLCSASAELGTDRVQKFHFKTATHYRKEFKDRDGTVYGEYGVHMPDGWTRVMLYEADSYNVQHLRHEYRTPTNRLLEDERTGLPGKIKRPAPIEEELQNETEPDIQIIAVPQLWKVRGQDLFPSASEQRPVTLTLTNAAATLAPPRLTDQRALYNFGYDAPHHGRNETGTEAGAKFGEYYVDLPNCWRSVVRYWADESGYHPTLRRMRTPGCVQQKREAVRPAPDSETGETAAVSGPSTRDQPSSAAPGQPAAAVRRQRPTDTMPADDIPTAEVSAAEVPAPAESEQLPRVDPSGPSPRSETPASCGTRSGDGQPATPGRPYGFAYNAGTHYHWERGFANGTKVGAYAVQLPDGTLRTTTYTADCNGFKPSVTVEPLDESKFLRDFEAFSPPKEAKLFERGEQPQASVLVRSDAAPAPPSVRRRPAAGQRSAEVGGTPPGLVQEHRKAETTTSAPTTTPSTTTEQTTTTAPPPTTAAAPRTSTSQRPPTGVTRRAPARRLSPIVPVRPLGSGPYHFYVHLRHNYHEERSYENGTVAGQYGVVGPDGVLREVGYTSEHGFVPTLTDTPVSDDHDLSTRPQKL